MFDVIIVGGSYAGQAAALQLGRARRKVLVVDAGLRRNRFAPHAHGFLGQDGVSPDEIAAKGRAEVLAYESVTWREALVTATRAIAGGFEVRTGDATFEGKRLILATGITDELPEIDGLAERWGKTAFHCPYCHGYELNQGALGVLATMPHSMHGPALVAEWAAPDQTTFFLNGVLEPDADQLADFAARGIRVERERVDRVSGEAPSIDVHLRDGRVVRLDGLFLVPRSLLKGGFAEQLGCELEVGPTGPFYKIDAMRETTVKGVYACGDAAVAAGSLSFAVAEGVRAGVGAHQSLVFRR